MYGAIIGDLAGSIYEFEQVKKVKPISLPGEIIDEKSFFSDDTILTIAVLDAIQNNRDYNKYLREYINRYKEYKPNFSPYFKSSFSPSLMKWSRSDEVGYSHGNGAMMRISPVGYLFNTESSVIENARLATIPSHNTKESIEAATTIALIIYYLRMGWTKEEIFFKLNLIPKYTPFSKFNTTCKETIDNCLYAFYYATGFEDAIKKVIAMGGDTDTNACIVGSLAEACFGVSPELIEKANEKLPDEFVRKLKKST